MSTQKPTSLRCLHGDRSSSIPDGFLTRRLTRPRENDANRAGHGGELICGRQPAGARIDLEHRDPIVFLSGRDQPPSRRIDGEAAGKLRHRRGTLDQGQFAILSNGKDRDRVAAAIGNVEPLTRGMAGDRNLPIAWGGILETRICASLGRTRPAGRDYEEERASDNSQ